MISAVETIECTYYGDLKQKRGPEDPRLNSFWWVSLDAFNLNRVHRLFNCFSQFYRQVKCEIA